ncbi:hypothetical protein PCE1_000982 [Barthelona sp. PCE]
MSAAALIAKLNAQNAPVGNSPQNRPKPNNPKRSSVRDLGKMLASNQNAMMGMMGQQQKTRSAPLGTVSATIPETLSIEGVFLVAKEMITGYETTESTRGLVSAMKIVSDTNDDPNPNRNKLNEFLRENLYDLETYDMMGSFLLEFFIRLGSFCSLMNPTTLPKTEVRSTNRNQPTMQPKSIVSKVSSEKINRSNLLDDLSDSDEE